MLVTWCENGALVQIRNHIIVLKWVLKFRHARRYLVHKCVIVMFVQKECIIFRIHCLLCAYFCCTLILNYLCQHWMKTHFWKSKGGSAVMTPVFWIFNPIGSLFYTAAQSDWPSRFAEKIGLSLSHLVPDLLGPKVVLHFHQNVFFNRCYAFCINFPLIFNPIDPLFHWI